jgi:hypothetical protein
MSFRPPETDENPISLSRLALTAELLEGVIEGIGDDRNVRSSQMVSA